MHSQSTRHLYPVLFSIALSAVLVACAGKQYFLADTKLSGRSSAIHRAGFLMPQVAVYEERVGTNVYKDDQSREAGKAVKGVLIEELDTFGMSIVQLSGDDPEEADILDLFVAVEVALKRSIWTGNRGDETVDFSVGPVKAFMERNNIDALWVITGRNLIPTAGRSALQLTVNTLQVLATLVHPTGPHTLDSPIRKELRIALIDKRGSVIYYGYANEDTSINFEVHKGDSAPGLGMILGNAVPEHVPTHAPGRYLKDTETARPLIKALVADYRKAVQR